jgi:cobalamin 5'-phosphate synthase/cobalamin synthase
MTGARRAVAFLTPLGGAVAPAPDALPWFPVVGLAIGGALGGLWWAAEQAWPPAVAAALVVAADLGLTGMLHFDGLVDSADGLLSHLDRPQRLNVMAAPDVGAFGIAIAGAVLLARWAALASIHPAPLLLAGLWCLSRTAMAVIATTQPYARAEGGLATAFLGRGRHTVALASAVAAAFVLAGLWKALPGPVSVAAAIVTAAGVAALARRRIGGFTGDVLGAAGLLAETVGLVVAAAKW